MQTFTNILSRLNKEIENIDWNRPVKGLYEPIGYILSLGGKRVRPALVLMCCNLYKENVDEAMSAAIGVEIFHNFTLLHDDIMDKADKRRGKPTVHKVWNDNTAILSGDVMHTEAFKWIINTPNEKLKSVLEIFTKMAAEICEGQQYDMQFESQINVTIPEYMEMIRLKTGVLLAAGCQIGGVIGGATEEDAENLYNFGLNLGLAFQLKDDLLDVYGDEKTFGKKIGGDIICNKKTFLLINALERAKNSEKESELNSWLNENDPNKHSEKIEAITDIYNSLEIKKLCEDAINEYINIAADSLNCVNINSEKKNELLALANSLSNRND